MKPAFTVDKKPITIIAVPCYGRLVRVDIGVERIFFLAEVSQHAAQLQRVSMEVWDPHGVHDLPKWLKGKEVSGVICSDTNCNWQFKFAAEGIWVLGGQQGEVAEVVQRWMAMERHARVTVPEILPSMIENTGLVAHAG